MRSDLVPSPIDLCGLPVHPLTLSESVTVAERLIDSGGSHQHVVLNAAKVVQAQDSPPLAEVIRSCDLVNADGQSIVWASRLLGQPLPSRVPGIDFMDALLDLSARRGYRVYFLGAEASVVDRVTEIGRGRGVSVVGAREGFWDESEESQVVESIRASRADILFLGIPSPAKEFFLARNLDQMAVRLAVGVGGSFDVVAGLRRRAPKWMQNVGLEWSYRLIQEPRRMLRRYLVGNARFIALVWRYRGSVAPPSGRST